MKAKLTVEEYKEIENLVGYALDTPKKKISKKYTVKIHVSKFDLQ